MLKMKLIGISGCIVLCLAGCAKKNTEVPAEFGAVPQVKPVSPSFPGEVSGMADSYSRPGYIWMVQDKDNPAELLTISRDGVQGPVVSVTGAGNQDWEDLSIGFGPEPGKKYLYIADVGDNFSVFPNYTIYRVEEPQSGLSSSSVADNIRFVYDDGLSHNSETMLVDPETKDILLVTKGIPSNVYRLAYPYSISEMNTAAKQYSLAQSNITGGAVSPDGSEIIVRTYSSSYYWKKKPGESLLAAIQRPAKEIPLVSEPQGESVTFKNDNSGFYTFSEKAGLPLQLNLYFYPRN